MTNELLENMLNTFGGKLRIRVLGLCTQIYEQEPKILLCKHIARTSTGELWGAIGGGVDFGETLHQALKREFQEEAHAEIEVVRFLFVQEYIKMPLHAVEIFFEVKIKNKDIFLGIDTELALDKQVISELKWFSAHELKQLPKDCLQKGLHIQNDIQELFAKTGFYPFQPEE